MAFVGEPPETDAGRRMYDADRESDGYVGNLTRLWAWRPDVNNGFRALWGMLKDDSTLEPRDWAILVAATASELGDSYCALAWGTRLASLATDAAAESVIRDGEPRDLSEREVALARWARHVVRDPNGTTEEDVAELRAAGVDDKEIFEATTFVAFRLAFSTVNDALGAAPDVQLAEEAPEAVRRAVSFGRPPA